jgi:adenosylcobinamide kinase / adenosylcobinamide-phosphate guanylyltransferase
MDEERWASRKSGAPLENGQGSVGHFANLPQRRMSGSATVARKEPQMKSYDPIQDPIKMLILGGCRSGKSSFAERWVASRFGHRALIATLQPSADPEVMSRIARHRQDRHPGWLTVEEPVKLITALERLQEVEIEVILVDCLTLWISNLLLQEKSDEEIQGQVLALAEKVRLARIPVIMVANEVGMGVVPEYELGRRFRDLAGWTNQRLADICGQVIFMAAGLPMILKGSLPVTRSE